MKVFLKFAQQMADDLYIPTNETMDIYGYKFAVRQEKLTWENVFVNEYMNDAFNINTETIQEDDWVLREKYRQMRRNNADIILSLIKDYINLLIYSYNEDRVDYLKYKDILPSFLKGKTFVIYKLYDYNNAKPDDGKHVSFIKAINDIVMTNANRNI